MAGCAGAVAVPGNKTWGRTHQAVLVMRSLLAAKGSSSTSYELPGHQTGTAALHSACCYGTATVAACRQQAVMAGTQRQACPC